MWNPDLYQPFRIWNPPEITMLQVESPQTQLFPKESTPGARVEASPSSHPQLPATSSGMHHM